jgi:hypothetical protein
VRIVVIVALLLVRAAGEAAAQSAARSRDSALVAALEQRIEDAVVARRLAVLDGAYAPGFRFKHSTGELERRAEWLASVARARFTSRQVDSLDVEVHGDVALTTGRLHVRRAPGDPEWATSPEWREYTVRYARVYQKRGSGWRLLTHHSTGQTFGPPAAPAPRPSPAG